MSPKGRIPFPELCIKMHKVIGFLISTKFSPWN
ncbi:hypothetical protein AB7M16_000579 [Bradyrhizobium sp. USDA 372]